MSQPSIFWWQKYGTLAQMAQAAVALLGFMAILFQINEIRSNNRAASARQAFLGYTDLAFKNPKFSAPDYDAIRAGNRDERVQYESFVSYFLYACEEATAAFAGRAEWSASCAYDLKPHLLRTFKISQDPQFERKFWDVIGLYLNPPDKALVLCCDEKSQCQALERTQPGLPLGIGHIRTRTHDYKRHGTITLFAALNYLDGKILSRTEKRHTHVEWLRFLKQIDRETPPGAGTSPNY